VYTGWIYGIVAADNWRYLPPAFVIEPASFVLLFTAYDAEETPLVLD
jgi:hypothetical protein